MGTGHNPYSKPSGTGWRYDILNIAFYVVIALLILFIAIQIQDVMSRKPTKDMLDFTYAVQIVGQEKAQVRTILGKDAKHFKASSTTEMETSLLISNRVYKLEDRGYVDVRLQYYGDSEDAPLEKVIYFLPFETNSELDQIWEWVYAQHQALEAQCGHEAEYISGNPMKEELGIRDVNPGNQWIYRYSQYMSITVAAEGLLRIELFGEEN